MAKNRKAKATSDGRHLLIVGLPVGIVLAVLIVGALLQSGPSPETDPPRAEAGEQQLPRPSGYAPRQWSDTALEENALEVDSETDVEAGEPPPPRQVRRELPASAPSQDSFSRLAQRVMEDVDRLGSAGHEWTAQIGVYCDDQRVSDLIRRHGNDPELYVLPVLLDERACFRICWGHYASHDQASQIRDLPAAFRGEKPLPRRVSTVIE